MDGNTWVIVDQPLTFNTDADRIILDDLVPANQHIVTIEGGATYKNAVFNRNADFSGALIESRHSRDWELRFKGLIFQGYHHTGPALKLDYVQLSRFEDLRIEDFAGTTPIIIGDTGVSSTVFSDVQLNANQGVGIIRNVSDFRWLRGNNQVNWGTGWGAGLEIRGGPQTSNYFPGPIVVDGFHMEGGGLLIYGGHKVTYRAGYMLAARVDINMSVGVTIDCKTGYSSNSSVYVDGVRQIGDCLND